jgi:hypothetical protein
MEESPPVQLLKYFAVVGVDPESDAPGITADSLCAAVVAQFPLDDGSGGKSTVEPLPESVPLFCLPQGVDTVPSDSSAASSVALFSFVLTNSDGTRSFGHCMQFYEQLQALPGKSLTS